MVELGLDFNQSIPDRVPVFTKTITSVESADTPQEFFTICVAPFKSLRIMLTPLNTAADVLISIYGGNTPEDVFDATPYEMTAWGADLMNFVDWSTTTRYIGVKITSVTPGLHSQVRAVLTASFY